MAIFTEMAHESKSTKFLTRNAIVNHLRLDSDRTKIWELLSKDKCHVSDILHAATVIHAYYFLGIHTKDTTELQNISVDSTQKVEDLEKKELLKEINLLLGDSVRNELEIFLKDYKYQQKLIEILQGRKKNEEELLNELRDDVEEDLLKVLRGFPNVYFYDYVGDLAGYSKQVQADILQEAAELRPTARDIEIELTEESFEEKYIEISKLKRIQDQMMSDFEFSSFKELELEAIPIKMIISTIMKKNVDYYPISERAITAFIDANKATMEIFDLLQKSDQVCNSADDIENAVKSKIKEEILKSASHGSNYFASFLQNFLGATFSETIATLSKYGIVNIPAFTNVISLSADKVRKQMRLYSITELDLKLLANISNNPSMQVQRALEDVKMRKMKEGHSAAAIYDITLDSMISPSSPLDEEIARQVFSKVKISQEEFRKYVRKAQIIREKFLPTSGMRNLEELVLCLTKDDILESLAKDVYFSILGEICRQLGRVLEMYLKIKDDKSKYLFAIKRIFETQNVAFEDWIAVKLEDLIIERLLKRQKELQSILGVFHDPYLVNGFIFARLCDKYLNDAINTFETEDSPVYADFASQILPKDSLSPVSYALAFDILKRFEDHEKTTRLKVEEAMDRKAEKKEEDQQKLKEKQDTTTYDWVERKISTSLIAKAGINPTQLYWTDKDTRLVADAIKHHTEMQEFNICSQCGQELYAKEQCDVDGAPAKVANVAELFANFYLFAVRKIQSIFEKMRVPEFEEVLKTVVLEDAFDIMGSRLGKGATTDALDNLLEGDRIELSQRIAKRIGKVLDNTIYKKFRQNQRG
ncbi:MAG TPA: hypothetical protein VKK79_19920 [Candidatus Lokiarchaeia archaeon]|nr:hypothetical protein [Candidatus Lokiarchaeia archaeon]